MKALVWTLVLAFCVFGWYCMVAVVAGWFS